MADHPNAATARAALEAFQSGDMARVAAAIAEDAVWHVPGSHKWAGEYRGRGDILGRFEKMAAEGVSQTQDDIHDVVGNDEHVVALVRMTLTAPGGSASTNSAFIYHVRDGQAVEFWAINDNQAAIDALLS